MNEIRHDPLSGHRVLIAEGRRDRPRDYTISHAVGSNEDCPFCAGNENQTPEEVFRSSISGGTDQWDVRIVQNKFPALAPHKSRNPDLNDESSLTMPLPCTIPSIAGEGLHEVIIESPKHCTRTTELGVAQLASVLQATAHRWAQIRNLSKFRSVQVFKNVGPAAGATMEHTHSQLIALPMVPPVLSRELKAMSEHREKANQCLLCEMQSAEKRLGHRLVAENDAFTAFCAYAGRQPGETWIVPKHHQADFLDVTPDDCRLLAEILDQVLRRLDVALQVPAYNSMIHSAPLEGDFVDHYHWRIVILPRITTQAGFEWGSGCYINPIAPERIALSLRRGVPVAQIPSRAIPLLAS